MYAISDMMHTSLAQLVIVFVVSGFFACFVGQEAGYSALLGGMAYAIPTALLVCFLVLPKKIMTRYKQRPAAVLWGEFIKMFAVSILYVLIGKYYENLYWPAFITSMIAVVNGYFIVLFKRN